MTLKVVLHNIRSIYNVGAILRTCEGFGVEEVVLSGYTPRYNDTDLLPHLRDKLNKQINKLAYTYLLFLSIGAYALPFGLRSLRVLQYTYIVYP